MRIRKIRADHSGHEVWAMNRLCPLELWDRGFESHSKYRDVCVSSVIVLSCVSSGFATGWSPVQ
jgi:hypothetical protein